MYDPLQSTELEYAGEQLEHLYFSLVFNLFTLAFYKSPQDSKPWSLQAEFSVAHND